MPTQSDASAVSCRHSATRIWGGRVKVVSMAPTPRSPKDPDGLHITSCSIGPRRACARHGDPPSECGARKIDRRDGGAAPRRNADPCRRWSVWSRDGSEKNQRGTGGATCFPSFTYQAIIFCLGFTLCSNTEKRISNVFKVQCGNIWLDL